jgi:lipopolysaccharide export system protein LptA
MMLRLFTLVLFSVMMLGGVATAQDTPIEITADKTLEWHRNELQYVANGNAVVKQGTTTIRADKMTADYRDSAKSSMDIYRMTGVGAVSIEDKGTTATGEHLVYMLDTGIATMTGKNLVMTSPEQTVTATEKFEYEVQKGQMTAYGNAKAVRGKDTLHADTIAAILVKDQNGKESLDRLEAKGNVKIITPSETLTGNRAVYNTKTNTAIVTGNVKITRDQNVLSGERAEIDLNTDISRLFGSSIEDGQVGGRVKGVFYPEGNKSQ